MQRHLAAAVAADRHQQQPFGGGRIADRVEPLGREVERQPQDLVGQEGISGGRLRAGIGLLLQPPPDLRAAGGERLLERRGGALAARLRQLLGERAPVDDLAPAGDRRESPGHQPASVCSRFSR